VQGGHGLAHQAAPRPVRGSDVFGEGERCHHRA
jgi:hypothetical protein